MSSVKFNLDKPKAEKTYILLKFSYKGKRLRYSTGLKVIPSHWNEKKQRLRELQVYPKNAEYNFRLEEFEKEVLEFFRNKDTSNDSLNIKSLKKHLDIFRGKVKKETKDSFFPFFRNFIESRSNSVKYKSNTIKAYTTTYKHLEKYCERFKIKEFDFEDIDLDFFEKFVNQYLFGEKKFSSNTVHKYIKNLKVLLNHAASKGIRVNGEYKHQDFSVKETETDHIYLNTNELIKIYQVDFSDRLGLDRVRDLFLVGAFTGLRFQDWSSVKKENFQVIDGNKILSVRTEKTGERVFVPVHTVVEAILSKYDNQLPRCLTNQKTNEALKTIAQRAKLDKVISITKNRGGIDYQIKRRQWQLVATHTARRSFASNAFRAGMPEQSIMKITGHKTVAVFRNYIRLTNQEHAVLMAKNAFFKMTPLKKIS